ncbi:MFS transporter [Actinocorallia longicatena]|uniref:MFS transporter n=1 Tax=Actinocorallia longicatena TaxID=111803 RepID=A0ABP6Q0M0_9ACTN
MATSKVPLASSTGRWIILATVLGSGIAFLDGSVVNVALPSISEDLGGGMAVLQWILDGYLLTLSALLLLGGALGDRYGRKRVFMIGLVVFTIASLGCGIAPDSGTLIVARLVQGVGGALLIPGSLALIDATIHPDDRGRAIGRWAGFSGVSSAVGPFVGGWLVDAASWRWVFLINLPLAAIALAVTHRHVPESRTSTIEGPLDLPGALAVTVGLGGSVFALIEGPSRGWNALTIGLGVIGLLSLAAFPLLERRQRNPLIPPELLRSRQFVGVNLTTLTVYAALGGAFFLFTLQLQNSMGYSALQAGVSTLPMTVIMMLLSSRIGALAQRTGPRPLMTAGPVVAGAGLALMTLAQPGTSYLTGVLPGVVVFGLGMSITVAPLTSTVLASVDEEHVGAASGANNAVARLAGLLAIAILPLAAGLDAVGGTGGLGDGYARAMWISAALCAAGGAISWFTVSRAGTHVDRAQPSLNHGCVGDRLPEKI